MVSLSRTPEYNRAWRKKRKQELGDYWTSYNNRWRAKHPARYILQTARNRAKKLNLEFNLTEGDISIPAVCPILNIPLFSTVGKGISGNSPSIDRIDNSLGYVKGNVQVISWRANDLKSNGTLGEFRSLVRWLEYGEKEKRLS
jgi:hypothetical protein